MTTRDLKLDFQKFDSDKFEKSLKNEATKIEDRLDKLFPVKENSIEEKISETMRYSLLNGGKRIRAYLSMESCRIYDISVECALQVGAAIECMHAYSLVHDDLPSMDNDDLRRGLPTVHIKWDEATAILTGDALQCKAFEILCMPETHPDSNKRNELIQQMAHAAGVNGMVSGQEADISGYKENSILKLENIIRLQDYKTGALIRWSAITGPLLADEDLWIMEKYAKSLGLAFQIQDDILDVEGNTSITGKKTNKDEDAGKVTFISLLGLKKAKKKAQLLIEDACDTISKLGPASTNLVHLAQFVIKRHS